jgi:uncharacterized protein (TIGR00297 family)
LFSLIKIMSSFDLSWSNSWLIGIALNTILIIFAFIAPKKLLTVSGYFHALILGIIVWGCLQWQGYAVVMFYFLVGSSITKVGMKQKEAEGIAEKRSGVRGPENVWGSALIGAICAIAFYFAPESWQQFCILGYVASFATKLSDTCASEIGKAYGKNTFLVTTLKPVPRGTEGAISLEGTLAGILASIAIAVLAFGIGMINWLGVLICIISAFIATYIESLIGATLQDKFDWLTNEIVNIINTFFGAVIAIALSYGLENLEFRI